VAEILEAWLVKYRKETENDPSKVKNNNLSVSDLLDEVTKKSKHDIDTVSNKGNSSVVILSASDSGVLRAIAKSEASTIDSKIDLVHDTNSPNARKSKSNAIAKATSPISTPQKSNASGSSPLLKPIGKSPTKKPMTNASSPAKTASGKSSSNVPLLVGAGVLTIILFAVILFAILANR